MSDTFWQYSGDAALILAIVVIAWALFFDLVRHRFRPPRRCPKCRYDLSRTEGLTCSECGYTARKERKFHKARRRWRLALLAIIPLIASDQLPRIPAIQERGWVAAVPTPALALSLLWIEPTPEHHMLRFSSSLGPPPPRTWHDDLFAELRRERLLSAPGDDADVSWISRQVLYTVAKWNDAEMFVSRDAWPTLNDMVLATARWRPPRSLPLHDQYWNNTFPREFAIGLSTRPSWPHGSVVYADIEPWIHSFTSAFEVDVIDRSEGGVDWKIERSNVDVYTPPGLPPSTGVWSDGLIPISRPGDDHVQYTFALAARSTEVVHFTGAERWCEREISPSRLTVSVDRVTPPILVASADAELTTWLAESFKASIVLTDSANVNGKLDGVYLDLFTMPFPLASRLLEHDLTLGMTVEIVANDKIIGRAQAWYHGFEETPDLIGLSPPGMLLPVDWTDDALECLQSGEEIRVHVRGDENVALRNFEATKYWDGEFDLTAYVSKDVRAMTRK